MTYLPTKESRGPRFDPHLVHRADGRDHRRRHGLHDLDLKPESLGAEVVPDIDGLHSLVLTNALGTSPLQQDVRELVSVAAKAEVPRGIRRAVLKQGGAVRHTTAVDDHRSEALAGLVDNGESCSASLVDTQLAGSRLSLGSLETESFGLETVRFLGSLCRSSRSCVGRAGGCASRMRLPDRNSARCGRDTCRNNRYRVGHWVSSEVGSRPDIGSRDHISPQQTTTSRSDMSDRVALVVIA